MKQEDLDILTLGLEEAWNIYKIECVRDSLYWEIRFGVQIKFDINDYIKGRLMTKTKMGKVMIRGKAYDLRDFETELEDREIKIKKWLQEAYEVDEPARARMDI